MDKQVVVMTYEKATKNKYVYQEEAHSPEAIHSLYIEEWAVGDSPPPRIMVTVEVV